MTWIHSGGGSWLMGSDPLACDDDYRELATDRRARFRCTPEVHFGQMPGEIPDMDAFIRSIAGRKDIRVELRVVPGGTNEDAPKAPPKES